MNLFSTLYSWWRAPFFSPLGLIIRGILILLVFWTMDALGYRDYTCVFTGTSPTGNPGDQTAILIGFAYLCLHFASILIAPTLILGGLIFLGFLSRSSSQRTSI